jgi:hypothetical protein
MRQSVTGGQSLLTENKRPVTSGAKYVSIADRETYAIKQINWWEKAYNYMNTLFEKIGRNVKPISRPSRTELYWGRSRLYYNKEIRDLVFSDSIYDGAYVDYYLLTDAVADGKLSPHPFIKRAARPAGYNQWKKTFLSKLDSTRRRRNG